MVFNYENDKKTVIMGDQLDEKYMYWSIIMHRYFSWVLN